MKATLRLPPTLMRLGARQLGRRVLDPSLSFQAQRQRLDKLMGTSPVPKGTAVAEQTIGGVRCDVLTAGPAPAVLAKGDDPLSTPAALAKGDDPLSTPAVLAKGDDPL